MNNQIKAYKLLYNDSGYLTSSFAGEELKHVYSTTETNHCDNEIFQATGLAFFVFAGNLDYIFDLVSTSRSFELWEVLVDELLPAPDFVSCRADKKSFVMKGRSILSLSEFIGYPQANMTRMAKSIQLVRVVAKYSEKVTLNS